QVEATRRRLGQLEPRIANDDGSVRRAFSNEREDALLRVLEDFRIDLVKRPALPGPPVTSQRPHSQTDDSDTRLRTEQAVGRLQRQTRTRLGAVIGRRRQALHAVDAVLNAVERGAM